MKKCTRCNLITDRFYTKETRCNDCVNKLRRIKYKENPELIKSRVKKYRRENPEKIRDTKLKQAYGVGIEYYNARLKEQNNVCGGCKRDIKNIWRDIQVQMALDHDHKTGQPRGVLCIKCNRALGLLEENEQTFLNLIDYINKYKKTG